MHDQANHHLGIGGATLRRQQRERNERIRRDSAGSVWPDQAPILVEEPEEEDRSDPLVAVDEVMILDGEVEQSGGLLLETRVKVLTVEGLHDRTKRAIEALVLLAATFSMGSPSGEVGRYTDETQHSVTISRSFFMGQTEVTQGQWKALSGGTNPSWFQSTTGTARSTANANDSGPVEYLDWYAAVAFANARSAAEGLTSCYTLTACADATDGWKDGIHSTCTGASFAGLTCTGYRLPTESEWEYAARGGTTGATYLGDLSGWVPDCSTAQANLDGIAWWCRNSGSRTNAVGGKTSNAFGLSDMLGNVWERTGDWSGTYPGTVTDPLGAGTGSGRVRRGGSWDYGARDVRAATRDAGTPGNRYNSLGFRLARTAP